MTTVSLKELSNDQVSDSTLDPKDSGDPEPEPGIGLLIRRRPGQKSYPLRAQVRLPHSTPSASASAGAASVCVGGW